MTHKQELIVAAPGCRHERLSLFEFPGDHHVGEAQAPLPPRSLQGHDQKNKRDPDTMAISTSIVERVI